MRISNMALALLALSLGGCSSVDSIEGAHASQSLATDLLHYSSEIDKDAVRHFGPFRVASGDSLRATLTTDSGDTDLYVRDGQPPTKRAFDCRPYFGGTDPEMCRVSGPAEVYLDVIGYHWTSRFTLSVVLISDTPPADLCGNATLDPGEVCDKPFACTEIDPAWMSGVAPCLDDCSGWDTSSCVAAPAASEQYFSGGIDEVVGAGQWRHYGPFNSLDGTFRALIGHNPIGHPGAGDVDLYVRRGEAPSRESFDCRSVGPESVESCALNGAGLYYVSVYGYQDNSRYAFEAYYWATATTPQPQIHEHIGAISADQWVHYGPFDGAAGQVRVTLAGRNDSDLYVKLNGRADATSYDCRPYTDGPDESCTFDSPGTYWVSVHGYSEHAYYHLRSVYMPD